MAMSLLPPLSTILLFLLLLLISPLATPSANDAPSAYELLAGYNFPIGLLPKGVAGFELDRSTGSFRAYLNGSCSFSLEGSYDIKYKPTISGYISQNRLTGLTGISVKVFILWLNIVEVVRDGDDIYFSVGIASAGFPIDNFFESPQCGCGFNCVNVKGEVMVDRLSRSGLLVSSS